MTTRDYAKKFGMSVGEWAELSNITTRQLQKLTQDDSEKFNNLLLITALKTNSITDLDELLKIIELHKLQKHSYLEKTQQLSKI